MSNTTTTLPCLGPDTIPSEAERLIPQDINYVLMPGTNTSAPWVAECCVPNPVALIGGCYVWCEIPQDQIHLDEDTGEWITHIDRCMRMNGREVGESGITALNIVGGTGKTGGIGMKGWVVWGLVVGVFMMAF